MAFASVMECDNCIKILHSLGKYVAPMEKEVDESHHNKYLVFKGDRTNRCDPPLVYFEVKMLQKLRRE